jgi:hypothetical protein
MASMDEQGTDGKSTRERRNELWLAAGFLLMALLVVFGAWREVAHHDGLMLVIAPATTMPVLASFLARRAARKKEP